MIQAANVHVEVQDQLREVCKLKFATYAADVSRVRNVSQPEDQSLSLMLYHEQRGARPFDRRFLIRRDLDKPQFEIVAATPRWEGWTAFYGNSMRLQMPPAGADVFRGAVALSGCLAPWIDEHDPWANSENMVSAVIREIETATASPGEPFSKEWVPDNLAREVAYQAGRIPETERAWR